MKKIIQWIWLKKWYFLFLPLILFSVSLISYWAVYPNLSPTWTGFGEYLNSSGELTPSKTLWDWLNLLIVPLVLAIGAWWLNKTEKTNEQLLAKRRADNERKLAEDQSQEIILQSYFDHMTNLLLVEGLKESEEQDEIRSIARARTLTTLRKLDATRKSLLVQFLREAGLISNKNFIINIKWADLSQANFSKVNLANTSLRNVNLSEANLQKSNLFQVVLSGADLYRANLQNAKIISSNLSLVRFEMATLTYTDFTESDLSLANLREADLENAYLQKANLRSADLTNAKLRNADFELANLSMAKLTAADLKGANLTNANLRGANLVDADLRNANLFGADLGFANLTGAQITEIQLERVKSLALVTK